MKKKNYFDNPGELKIDLMLRGVRIIDPVVKAWACGVDGIDIRLAQNTLVNIPCSEPFTEASPYEVKRVGEGYEVTDGVSKMPVEFVPKPEFYAKKTTTGVPFSKIASVRGSYTVITPSPRCDFFDSKIECRYCAGNFDITGADQTVYSTDEVLETAEAVLKERPTEIIYLSIGFTRGDDGGVDFLRPYINAIKSNFNCLVAIEAMPPKDNRWIDETYAMGADSVLYNLEIFDKELFELICPGRASLIGRQRYLDALKYAAGVFPNGTVASHLIVGLEPPGSTAMGIDFFTSIGVVPILPIYRPSGGRALRIEPLNTEIIIPVYKHLYKAVKKTKLNCKWVRDISTVTTPIEGALLAGETNGTTLLDSFYKTKLGHKTAWGLSTLRRKLRVKEVKDPKDPSRR